MPSPLLPEVLLLQLGGDTALHLFSIFFFEAIEIARAKHTTIKQKVFVQIKDDGETKALDAKP